jgi:hypothetical protein
MVDEKDYDSFAITHHSKNDLQTKLRSEGRLGLTPPQAVVFIHTRKSLTEEDYPL